MEAASTNNQSLPISTDETVKFIAYSSAVHKVVVMVNAGVLGLLQLINQQSSVLETHKATFLCLCVFILFYPLRRVREAVDVRLRPGIVQRLFGHTSHLFGGLATLVLISVVCAVFAQILLLLWLLWLSAIVYSIYMNSCPTRRQKNLATVHLGRRRFKIYTAVYASSASQERTDRWVELISLHNTFSLYSSPWILGL